jgi:tetratricopeptide (TPR) repeat protein
MTSRRIMLLAVIGAALLVYANSLYNGFAYDDIWIIARNDRVHQLHNLRSILFTPYWPTFGTELGLYRPLTVFAYALEWAVSGGAPWFFHLVNVLLHVSACLLVFLIVERLLSERAAFAAALLFAIHPLHTEAVANVVGQGELWTALCVLFACAIWVRRAPGKPDARTLAAILLLYALSLLFKESSVVLPGLLVLLDVIAPSHPVTQSPSRYAKEMAFPLSMMTLILLGFLTLRVSVLGNIIGTDAAPGLPYLHEQYRVLNAFRAWPEFVRLLLFPMDLSVDYSPGMILPVTSLTPMVALGALMVLGCVALMLAAPRYPRAGLIAGWFFLTILPVSNLLFPIGVLIAERTLYLPSLSVCLLAGLAWDYACRSVPETRRLATAVSVAIIVVFSGRTVVRNTDWDSLLTVWHSLERDHPESYRSQWLRAISLWSENKPRLAEQYFLLAYRIWPRDSQMLKEFGNFYIGQRRYDKAMEYLERSRNMTPFVPQTWELLSYAYLYGNRPKDALRSAQHATTMEGYQRSLSYAVIAGAYYKLGRYADAVGAWRIVTRSRGGDLWLNWAMLARSLAAAGNKSEALGAANVAYSKTLNRPPLQDVINKLKVAIESGCYPKGQVCDPLEGWAVAGATSVPATGK